MSDRSINVTIIIVLIVLAFAGLGVNYLANAIGLSDAISNSIGSAFLVGMIVLYIIYRNKESKEITKLKEDIAHLEEKNKKTDYYIEKYEYYHDKYWQLKKEMDSYYGKED